MFLSEDSVRVPNSGRKYYRDDRSDTSGSKYYRKDGRQRSSYFEVHLGLVLGSGFGDALANAYSDDYDISGGGGGVNLGVGFGFPLRNGIALVPRLRLLAYSVEFRSYPGLPGNSQAGIMLLPGVAGRYTLGKGRHPLYATVGLSLASWMSDLKRFEVSPAGFALDLGFGFTFGDDFGAEFAYLLVPCKVTGDGRDYGTGSDGTVTSNFGGLSLVFCRRFGL
jgi:hypothetical protein